MLTVISISVCLCAVAVVASVMVVRMAGDRLDLDLMSTLLWFGLAEWPTEPRPPRTGRPERDPSERPVRRRRRSAHRSRGRRSVPRRPAGVPPTS